MKLFNSINLIISMAIQPCGAVVQQQIFERTLTFSDNLYRYLWEVLLVVSYLAHRVGGLHGLVIEVFDTVFLAWQENLVLIVEFLVKVVLYHAPIPSPYG